MELSVCEGIHLFQQVLGQHDNDWVSRLHKNLKNLETYIFFTVSYSNKVFLFAQVSKWPTIKLLVCVQCDLHHMLLNVGQALMLI